MFDLNYCKSYLNEMTHLFLGKSTDKLHHTLLLPGGYSVVHGCEGGVIDLDFISSILCFGFLCNKQVTGI